MTLTETLTRQLHC